MPWCMLACVFFPEGVPGSWKTNDLTGAREPWELRAQWKVWMVWWRGTGLKGVSFTSLRKSIVLGQASLDFFFNFQAVSEPPAGTAPCTSHLWSPTSLLTLDRYAAEIFGFRSFGNGKECVTGSSYSTKQTPINRPCLLTLGGGWLVSVVSCSI